MRFEQWKVAGFDRDAAVTLTRAGINPLISVFLASRGITDAGDANDFLKLDIGTIEDPFLLPDMEKAVDRIKAAVANGEKIAVYGDYDVDGMTSSALMATYFRRQGVECEIYIPERMDEGYGVNIPALEMLMQKGVTLVVTVDCGITAIDEVQFANDAGLDIVITDHHECKDKLPDAVAVVNPKRADSAYPNSTLAGVGVAFKLACALERDVDINTLVSTYADLVAVGTIADVMPVTGENRTLIRAGLRVLDRRSRPGLQRLMEETFIQRKSINTAAIGFALAPRLNAAGRMGRTSLSVELLLTSDADEATELTLELCRLNEQRRQLESEIFEEAVALYEANPVKGPIVLGRPGWFQGVMGIVAAKMAEMNMFPALMISIDEYGVGRGSCRSFGSFKLHTALVECADLLENYGGHEMAAGLTIMEKNIPEFARRMNTLYHEQVKIAPVPTLRADFEVVKPELLSLENVTALAATEPYGSGFLPPYICMRDATISSITAVGGGKHSKMKASKGGKAFDCIYFGVAPSDLGVREGAHADLIFEPHINEYRQWKNVQLHIMDIARHGER